MPPGGSDGKIDAIDSYMIACISSSPVDGHALVCGIWTRIASKPDPI
jgi:hypothetical protein